MPSFPLAHNAPKLPGLPNGAQTAGRPKVLLRPFPNLGLDALNSRVRVRVSVRIRVKRNRRQIIIGCEFVKGTKYSLIDTAVV